MENASPDLMGLVNRQFTPDVIQRAASELGEDGDCTARAVSASVPSVLTALSEVASSSSGANHIEAMIDETRRSDERMSDGGQGWRAAGEAGSRFLDGELGYRTSSMTDAIAGSSGIRRDSAHKLLGGVTTATLLALGRNMLGASALRSASRAEGAEWSRRLPGPLASMFGATEYRGPTAMAADRSTTSERYSPAPARGPALREAPRPRRNMWLPLLLLAILLAWALVRGFRHPAAVQRNLPRETPTEPQQMAPAPDHRPQPVFPSPTHPPVNP